MQRFVSALFSAVIIVLLVSCFSSSLSNDSSLFVDALLSPTYPAQYVLTHGNITGYINTLFTINEPLPDGTPRIGGKANLAGCVRKDKFQQVAETLVFVQSHKKNMKNVTECLSFCTALRRLDYWLQSSVNNNADVPIVELAAGVDSDGTCWCMPQNMTTVDDVQLWSRAILGELNQEGGATTTTTAQSSSSLSYFNDIFLPPSCCDKTVNPMLLKPGAPYVNPNVSSSSSSSCPTSISPQERRDNLISIFESTFSCGISTTCMNMQGCVRHLAFKPPSSYVTSFDSCVPLIYPEDSTLPPSTPGGNGGAATEQPIQWDASSILRLTGIGLFTLIAIIYGTKTCYDKRRERLARERLLVARGDFGGNSTASANVASLLGGVGSSHSSNNNSSSSRRNGGGRRRTRYPGDPQDSSTNNNDDEQELETRNQHHASSAEDMKNKRELLNKLPTSALATRPLEICRMMASTVVQSTLAAMNKKNKKHNNDDRSGEDRLLLCRICLEKVDKLPLDVGSDEAVSRLPTKITLPECGHSFHTLCLFRQLVFHAQKIDQFEAEKQQLSQLEKLNEKEGFGSANSSSSFHNQFQKKRRSSSAAAAASRLYNPCCSVCQEQIVSDPAILDQLEGLATGKKLLSANPLQ